MMIRSLALVVAYAACCFGQTGSSMPSFSGMWMYYPSGMMMSAGGTPEGNFNGYTADPSGPTIMVSGMMTSDKFYAYGSVSYTDSSSGASSSPTGGMYMFPICASGDFSPAVSGSWLAKGNIGAAKLEVSGLFGPYAGMETMSGSASSYNGELSSDASLPAQSTWFSDKKWMTQCGALMTSAIGDDKSYSIYASLMFGSTSGYLSVTYSESSGVVTAMGSGYIYDTSAMMTNINLASVTPSNGEYTAVGTIDGRPFTAAGQYGAAGSYNGFYTIDSVKVTKNKCDLGGNFYGAGMEGVAVTLSGSVNCHDGSSSSVATPTMGNSLAASASGGSLYGLTYNGIGADMSGMGTGSAVSVGTYGSGAWSVSTEFLGVSIEANGQYGIYGAFFADKYSIKCGKISPASGSSLPGMESIIGCGDIKEKSGVKSLSMNGYVGAQEMKFIDTTLTTSGSGSPGMDMLQLAGYAQVGSDASFPIEGYFYGGASGSVNQKYVEQTGTGSGAPATTISFNAQVNSMGDVAFISYGYYSKM